MREKYIIAIDGPAASGKSTTARLLASELKYIYIDTGAMYRACALRSLQANISLNDYENLRKIITDIRINIEYSKDGNKIYLNGVNVSKEIRSPEVTKISSEIATIGIVRDRMVELQREMGKNGGIIMDGRDIGTVVFPDADFKFYMLADAKERAERRCLENREKGIAADFNVIYSEIIWRDKNDSERVHSPLRKADDAILIDTTAMTIQEQVEIILAVIQKGKS